jgi:hypothetical protein
MCDPNQSTAFKATPCWIATCSLHHPKCSITRLSACADSGIPAKLYLSWSSFSRQTIASDFHGDKYQGVADVGDLTRLATKR